MKSFRYAFIIIILVTMLILVVGCRDRSSTTGEAFLPEQGNENNNEASVEENAETIARRGASDRLPGSLQWGSIIIFQNGEDFLLDYPDQGLRAVNLASTAGKATASEDKSATTEPVSTETKSTETKSTETKSTETAGAKTEDDETKSAEAEGDEAEGTEKDGFTGVRTVIDENGVEKTVFYRDGEIVMEVIYEGDSSTDSRNTRHDSPLVDPRRTP